MPPAPADPAWERARRRSSRRRTYLLGGAVAAAAAAVVAGLLVFLPSGSPPAHAGSGQGSPRGGTPTSSAAAPTPTGLVGSRIRDTSGLSLVVPTGWTSSQGSGESGYGACLTPQEFDGAACGHGGLEIQSWAKGEQPGYDTPTGWANYGDAGNLPGCVSDTTGDLTKAITADGVTVRGTRPVGGRTAVYREYRLQCRNGFSSTPRLWWLPQSGVLIETIELPDRYRATVDAIVRSIELSGYQRPDAQTG